MLKRLCLGLALLALVSIPASAAIVKVKADNTPLRAGPSATAAVLQTVKAGTTFDLVDVERDWYKVRDPKTRVEGYFQAASVELLPGVATAAGAAATTAKPDARSPQGQTAKPATPTTPAGAPGAKPRTVAAKRPPKKGDWLDMGYLSINGIYQGGAAASTQSLQWNYFGETALANVQFPAKSAPGFDANGGYRIWRNLAVGAGVTAQSTTTTAGVTGTIPNPLYLNRPRTLAGSFTTKHAEMAIHVQAAWVIPMPPRMMLMVFGGPSIFSVTRTIVPGDRGLTLTDVYPYDTVALSATSASDQSKTVIGFGGGADFTYLLTKTIGVGGMVRYARGTGTIAATGSSQAVAFDAGGFQAGGGVRVFFGAPKPAKPATPVKPQPKPPNPPKK